MKRVNICFEIEKEWKKEKEYIEKISGLAFEDGIEFLFLEIDCKEIEDRDVLYAFFKWIKTYIGDIEKKYNVLIRCSAVINPHSINSKVSGLLARWILSVKIIDNPSLDLIVQTTDLLKKRKIEYSILVKEAELVEKYLYYKNKSISVSVPRNYSGFGKRKVQFFNYWAYDVEGCDINLFSNIASSVLSDYEGDCCIHNSCLGKTLNVSSEGNIYFCKYHKEISYLARVEEVNCLKDIYSKESFNSILRTEIIIRKECAENCNAFSFCHSGCPLVQKEAGLCSESIYVQFYKAAAEEIIKIADNADYSKINPYLRLKLLSAIASGNDYRKKEEALIYENT